VRPKDNNFLPLKTNIFLNFSGIGQGWQNILRVHSQTADNFKRNSLACGNLSLLTPCFYYSSDVLSTLPSCPVGPLLSLALAPKQIPMDITQKGSE